MSKKLQVLGLTMVLAATMAASALAAPWSGSGTYTVGSGGDYATLGEFCFAALGTRQGTGTISVTAGATAGTTTTLTGVSTLFTSEAAPNDWIFTRNPQYFKIVSIPSNTSVIVQVYATTVAQTGVQFEVYRTPAAAMTGNVDVQILAGGTVEPNNILMLGNTNGFTLTFKPAPSATPTVTFTRAVDNQAFSGHILIGLGSLNNDAIVNTMDNVVFDGSNNGTTSRDMTFLATDSYDFVNFFHVVGGNDNVVAKNMKLVLNNMVSSGSGSNIFRATTRTTATALTPPVGFPVTFNSASTVAPQAWKVLNNDMYTSGTGLGAHQAINSTSSGTIPAGVRQENFEIKDNKIYARVRGIFLNQGGVGDIQRNEITVNQLTGGFDSFGILLNNAASPVAPKTINWSDNKLDIKSIATAAGLGANGMYVTSAGGSNGLVYNVYNNTIILRHECPSPSALDLEVKGIYCTSGVTYNVYNNSIYIKPNSNLTGMTVAANFGLGGFPTASLAYKATFKNNIVYSSIANVGCIVETSAPSALGSFASDNNSFYYVNGAVAGRYLTTAQATLANWQSASGQDANSVSLDPTAVWVSTSDLHYNGNPGSAWKIGASVIGQAAGLAKDIDAADRDVIKPYLGADEPVAPDAVLTVVSAYGTANPPVGASNTTSGTLINASVSGSPVAGPAGTQYVCTGYTGTGSVPSGSGTSASFTITNSGTLTWNWTTQYALTTAANPAVGTVSGAGWYDSGTNAPVQATATTPGWYFGSWTGDLTGTTNPDNVLMNAPKSVTANFVTPDINLPVASHNYGSELVGDPAVDFNFPVQNVGGYQLAISDVSRLSGSTDFTVQSAPATVAANTTGTLTIRYTPNTAGVVSAVIQITSDDIDETTTTLSVSAFGISSNVAVIGGHANLGAWTPASAPNMNDLGISGDAASGDMIYTLQVDVPTTPTEWKILKDKNLGFGGGNDVGRQADGNWNMPPVVGNGVKFFYDVRDLTSAGWTPATEGLGSSAYSSITWVAVGSFQSEAGGSDWDPDSATTEMHDDGLNGDTLGSDGIFTFQFSNSAALAPGEWLVISDQFTSWGGEIKFGSNGMAVDPGGVTQPQFTIGLNGTVKMEFDAWHGHIRLTLTPPASVNDWTMY